MKKKILAIALIAVVLCVCFTACGSDDTGIEEVAYFDSGAMKYVLLKEKNPSDNTEKFYAKAVSYIGEEFSSPIQNVSVTIPSKVTYEDKEYDVVSVGSLAFNRKKVTNIYVEEGISIIDNFAFGYCDLTYVELPSTITDIGEYAFVGCNSFGELRINAVTPPKLGGYAFKIYNEGDNVYVINGKLRIYVPQEAESVYKNTQTDSSWSEYSGIISKQ